MYPFSEVHTQLSMPHYCYCDSGQWKILGCPIWPSLYLTYHFRLKILGLQEREPLEALLMTLFPLFSQFSGLVISVEDGAGFLFYVLCSLHEVKTAFGTKKSLVNLLYIWVSASSLVFHC